MFFLKATLVVAFGFAVQVASHGHPTFVESVQSSKRYECFQPYQYQWATLPTCSWRDKNITNQAFVPVSEYGNRNINCHVGATPADVYVEVEAGGEIIIEWTPWPVSHHGPVITYLGACNGECTNADLDVVEWVKIAAVGQIEVGKTNSDAGYWGADKLRAENNTARVQIPSSIQAGNYLCRHEIIALMGASNLGVAQNYPNCINLKISGSGTDPLPSGTKGIDLYKATDPGIHVMIYGTTLKYQIPGPPMYSGSSSDNMNTTTDAKTPDLDNTDKRATTPTDKPLPSKIPVHPSNGTTDTNLSPHGSGTKSSYTSQSTGTKSNGYTKPTNDTLPMPDDSTTSKPDDSTTPKPDDSTTSKPDDSTTPKPDDSTTSKPDDSTTPKPDVDTTPKSHYTSDTTDNDLKVPEGASASQLLDIIDRCVQALRKAVGNRRRHARAVHS